MPFSPEVAMAKAADLLSGLVSRIPDGEMGRGAAGSFLPDISQFGIQPEMLWYINTDLLEPVDRLPMCTRGESRFVGLKHTFFRIPDGVTFADLPRRNVPPPDALLRSFEIFLSLKESGRIPGDVKFQVTTFPFIPLSAASSYFVEIGLPRLNASRSSSRLSRPAFSRSSGPFQRRRYASS
jgi:hypothetical protein